MSAPFHAESRPRRPTAPSLAPASASPSNRDEDGLMEFNSFIEKARSEDFSDLIRCGCVQVFEKTSESDCAVVVALPKLCLQKDTSDQAVTRMMHLLLLKMHDVASGPYILIYSHTPMSILSQQSVIVKYYRMLPHSYKKNMKKLLILRPNFTVKLFFEFARVFLSEKFYKKLNQFSSILDIQQIVPPSVLNFPIELHHLEDIESPDISPEPIVSISESFIPDLNTTYFLYMCINFLREQNALSSKGIFRISGDDTALTVAKRRLQKKNCSYVSIAEALKALGLRRDKPSSGTILICRTIIIGTNATISREKYNAIISNIDSDVASSARSIDPISSVNFNEINTVAQLIKFSLREIADPIITPDAYREIEAIYKKAKEDKIDNATWGNSVVEVLKQMPTQHYKTLDFLLVFLAEVAGKSSENQMTPSNLAIVFGPGVMRKQQNRSQKAGTMAPEDAAAVMAEMAIGQAVVHALIDAYIANARTYESSSTINTISTNSASTTLSPSLNSSSSSIDVGDIRISEAMLKRAEFGFRGRPQTNKETSSPPDDLIDETEVGDVSLATKTASEASDVASADMGGNVNIKMSDTEVSGPPAEEQQRQ